MDQVHKHIWIGNRDDRVHAQLKGCDAVLNLAREIEYAPPQDLEYMKVPLNDDETNTIQEVTDAVSALHNFVSQGKTTLVHCRSGVSRAPSIVALYLHDYEGWSLRSALEHIQRCRPRVNPGDGMWVTTLMAAERTGYESTR